MSITYAEIASSGISEEDFDTLFASRANFSRQVEVYRQNPKFTIHSDLGGDITTSNVWASAATNNELVVLYRDGTDINYKRLALEDNDPSSLNEWETSSFDSCMAQSPIACTSLGDWVFFYYISSAGEIIRHLRNFLLDLTSATTLSSHNFLGTTVEWISVAEDGIGPTVYIVMPDDQGNRRVFSVGSDSIVDTGINWPDVMTGFSVQTYNQHPDDTSGDHADTNIRHCITLSSTLPNLYKYKVVDGLPVEETQVTGGIVSFVVRPPTIDGRPAQVSEWYPIRVFDTFVEGVQYRKTCRSIAVSSLFKPSDIHDTLFISAVGSDGDIVGSDTFGYDSAYFYSSRDGANWSADQILPVVDLLSDIESSFDDISDGIQLARLGNYIYAVTRNCVFRSLGCGLFGVVHPNLYLDISSRVISYSSTASDMRQTSFTVNNQDRYFASTVLGQPGTFRVKTSIGGIVGGETYKFVVSIEEIDAIESDRERPNEYLRISSRDLMSALVDRSQAQDAMQYDSSLVGADTYDSIGGQQDSGLAHTAVQSGVFGTFSAPTYNYLSSKSSYHNSVAFSTFKTSVFNGSCHTMFSLPNPSTYTPGATAETAPTYAGVVFRGVDKDNYWFARYNWWTGLIEVGERKAGVDTIRSSVAPSDAFISAVTANTYTGIRVEFQQSRIRVWHTDPDNNNRYVLVIEYYSKANTIPSVDPKMMQGYTGVVACGYSDQDQGDGEPDPVIIGFDGNPTDWGTQNDFVPTRLVVMQSDGTVVRYSNITSTPIGLDISPTNADRGTSYWMEVDPWNYKRLLMLTDTGVYELLNWTTQTVPSAWTHIYTPTVGNPQGMIKGSINKQGYWFWLEYIDGSTTYLYFTYDNFSTTNHSTYFDETGVHDTNFGGNITSPAAGGRAEIQLTSFASDSPFRAGYVYVSGASLNGYPYLGVVKTVWGTNPEQIDPPRMTGVGDQTDWGGFTVPYKLRGGADNLNDDQMVWTKRWREVVVFNRAGEIEYDTNGQVDGYVISPGGINSFTLDGKRLYRSGDSSISRSDNGGQTWSEVEVGAPGLSINGWPTNPDFLVGTNEGAGTYITTDGLPNIHILDGVIGGIVAFADLTELYDAEVHPA